MTKSRFVTAARLDLLGFEAYDASVLQAPSGRLEMDKGKVKVWVLVIALLTRLERQRFTISEVASDWHELMIPWRIMRPSIARDGEQLDPRCSTQTYHRPNQRTRPSPLGLHSVAREL